MKVNALIIGAGRSGTTTLYQYMKKHPQLCFSSYKEIHYFSFEDMYARGPAYLGSFFKHCEGEKVLATADTYIMPAYDSHDKIKRYNPDMKFIAILRDPVERAYSNFIYSLNNGYEEKGMTFLRSFEKEPERLRNLDDIVQINNLCHFYTGKYAQHLEKWAAEFPKEQFFVTSITELKNDTERTLKNLFTFLGLEDIDVTETSVHANRAAVAKSKQLQQLLLNRNHPSRKAFRKLFPPAARRAIMESGIVNTLYKFNKSEKAYRGITRKEYDTVAPYFEEDRKLLEENWSVRV